MTPRADRVERTPAPDTKERARIIGARLRNRRGAGGWTRLGFVGYVDAVTIGPGITWAKLQHYEDGRGLPNLATLMKLAAALGLTVGGFLAGIEKDLAAATAPAAGPARPDATASHPAPAARPTARLGDVTAG